jgi:hypothetical protein
VAPGRRAFPTIRPMALAENGRVRGPVTSAAVIAHQMNDL